MSTTALIREIRINLPQELVASGTRVFAMGACRILLSREPDGWHLSISHPKRYPIWDEIKRARYALTPHDVTMAMILPPPSEFVNIHPNCFHLYEIPNEGKIITP